MFSAYQRERERERERGKFYYVIIATGERRGVRCTMYLGFPEAAAILAEADMGLSPPTTEIGLGTSVSELQTHWKEHVLAQYVTI